MITFMFWNTQKKQLIAPLQRIVQGRGADVVLLAESTLRPELVLDTLNEATRTQADIRPLLLSPGLCRRIQVFSRFENCLMRVVAEKDDTSIRLLALPGRPEILVASVHLVSKVGRSPEDQMLEAVNVVRFIRAEEERWGHRRTIVVGDFNMNPFEAGMVAAECFNAVPTRALASRTVRYVRRRDYPLFYNPMWSCFGDRTEGPPGTYFFDLRSQVGHYWNMLDQVLLRPDLMNSLTQDGVSIVDHDGVNSLLSSQGRPHVSDHLPIVFSLDI